MEQHRYNLPKVKDFMTSKVISFTLEMDLSEVLKVFNKHRISSGPVVKGSEYEVVIGFLSEDDLMRELAGSSYFDDPMATIKVAEAMAHEVQTIHQEMDLFKVEKIFRENKLRHAPVVDEFNRLEGIVTSRDILRALERLIGEIEIHTQKVNTPMVKSALNEFKLLRET